MSKMLSTLATRRKRWSHTKRWSHAMRCEAVFIGSMFAISVVAAILMTVAGTPSASNASGLPEVRGDETYISGNAYGIPKTGGMYGDRYTDIGIMPETLKASGCLNETDLLRNNVGVMLCSAENPQVDFVFWIDDLPESVTVTVGRKWHDPFLDNEEYRGAAPWYWYRTPTKLLWTLDDGATYVQEIDNPERESNYFKFPAHLRHTHVTMTVLESKLPACEPNITRGVVCPEPGAKRPIAIQRVRFNKAI